MDRIDIWVEVGQIDHKKLSDRSISGESTKTINNRVSKARELQKKRFKKHGSEVRTNSEMGVREIEEIIQLDSKTKETLNTAATKMELSPRAYHRVIKIARTIADLSDSENVEEIHILEALQYRPRQKQY